MATKQVSIIGAGIAGLTAAYYLKTKAIPYRIFEKSSKAGGRVDTEMYNGFLLDRGFQVFLDAYPEAQKVLDYDALGFKSFMPGAAIIKGDDIYEVIDPTRQPSKLFSAAFSPIGSMTDKLKVLSLRKKLAKLSVSEIFEQEEKSTYLALKEDYDFSEAIINDFFKPFFSGIFFEKELNTSRRMFDFVYKMFSEGNACLPSAGIGAIADQLVEKIGKENIQFDAEVTEVSANEITLKDGEKISGPVLVATEAAAFTKKLGIEAETEGQSCWNFYFEAAKSPFEKPLILLNSNANSLITTLAVPSDVQSNYASQGTSLVSVTVLAKEMKGEKKMAQAILKELQQVIPTAYRWNFIKSFKIKYALPKQEVVTHDLSRERVRIESGLYVCGDYLLNGSVNAAMKTGRIAADAIAQDFQ